MFQLLQVLQPERSCTLDVLRLGFLVATGEKKHNFPTAPSEVQAVPWTEVQSSFPDAAANFLVVAQVARLEAQDPRLHPSTDRDIQLTQPIPERDLPAVIDVLADDKAHLGIIISNDNYVKPRSTEDRTSSQTAWLTSACSRRRHRFAQPSQLKP